MQQPLPLSTPATLWKRNRNRKLLFLLGFVFAFVSIQAQTIYPVQSTTRIIAPYSVYLPDYAVNGNDKLQCLLVNRDATATTYQVRLRLTVKLNGRVIMQTSPSFNPAPIALTPNSLQLFAGSTLEPYLKSENLEFVGYSQELYEQNRALPEGFYEICFAAFDYFRQDVQVSNDGCGFYFLAKNEPPLINGPACGNKIQPQYSTPIRFSWLPRNTASVNSNNSTIYRLFIYEVNPRGTNPNDIVNSLPPIYVDSTNVNQTYYDLLPTTTLFRDSMEYVWRVQAVDINGSDLFRNNGYSQVCTFTWGGPGANPFGAIDSVLNLNAIGETERKGKMWWTKDLTKYDSYKVHYKKSGSGYSWFTSETENDTLRVFDLEPDTEYECRIQGRKNGSYGIYSEVRYFRTKKIIPKDCNDESLTAIATSGRPMLNLLKGTTITYRDFEISVTDFINNGNGWYKGSGIVSIPFLLGLNFAVEFDNILIDDAGVVSQGEVRFVSNDLQDWINKKIKAENGGDDVGDVKSGDDAVDKNLDYDISDPTKIKVLGPVVNGVQQPVTNGVADLVITKPDGTTDTLKAVTLPYTIKDKDGDIYSIGKDGKVTKVGKSGAMPGLNAATLNKVQLDKAKVTFKAHPSQQYAFDAWQTAFAGKPIVADEYEKLTDSATNTVYYVSNKAIGAAKTDKVIAKIEITDNSIVADSIKFVTAKGTQFESNKTSTANEYEVQLVGGPGGDAQELFAVYKKADGTLMTLGKLKISAYNLQTKKIVIVPVNGTPIGSVTEIEKKLKAVYNPVCTDFTVTKDHVFTNYSWISNADSAMNVEGSGLFSQYSSSMKVLNRAYARARKTENDTYYIFLLKRSTQGDLAGEMPRGEQFGYVFTEANGNDINKIAGTITHEIGHGAFRLYHTFDDKIGLPKGSTKNVMDYPNGDSLYKFQWDQIHDPGVINTLLSSEADEQSVILGGRLPKQFRNADSTYTFITPSGSYITLPVYTTGTVFWYGLPNLASHPITTGSLVGFTFIKDNGDKIAYNARFSNGNFLGYFTKDNNELPTTEIKTTYENRVIMGYPYNDRFVVHKLTSPTGLPPYNGGSSAYLIEKNFTVIPFSAGVEVMQRLEFTGDNFNGLLGDEQQDINGDYIDMITNHTGKKTLLPVLKIIQLRTLYPNIFRSFSLFFDNWDSFILSPAGQIITNLAPSPVPIEPGVWDVRVRDNATLYNNWKDNPVAFYNSFIDEFVSYCQTYANTKKFEVISNLSSTTKLLDLLVSLEYCSDDEIRTRFSAHQRLMALSILANNKAVGDEAFENQVVRLLKFVPDNELHADSVLTGLKGNNLATPTLNKKLIYQLIKHTDDSFIGIGRNNYKNLILAFTQTANKAKSFKDAIKQINVTNFYDYNVVYYYKGFFSRLLTLGTAPAPPYMFTTAEVDSETSKVTINTEMKLKMGLPGVSLYKKSFDLFAPIWFSNNSNISLLQDFAGKEGAFMPAIVAKYADDKGDMETSGDVINAAIDVVGLASGYTEIKAGITGVRKLMVIADIVGSGMSLTDNLTEGAISNQYPLAQGVLNAMNALTGALQFTKLKNKLGSTPDMQSPSVLRQAYGELTDAAVMPKLTDANAFLDNIVLAKQELNQLPLPERAKAYAMVQRLKKEGQIYNEKTLLEKVILAEKTLTGAGKASLLARIDGLTNLKAWVNDLDNAVDAGLISKLDGLDATDLAKLEVDIASVSNGPGLKTLLKENPDDLTDIWKVLKDDPKYSFELAKTGGSRWEKWAQGNFFKTITQAGKDFELFVSNNLSVLRTKLLSKYPNIDLNNYAIFEQVQIKTGRIANGAEEFFVADFVLVKKKTVLGQEILDFDDAIVLETKLSSSTALTTPQTNALAKVKTTSNTFDIRSISKTSTTDNIYSLGSGTSYKTVKVIDYIKVSSDGIGNTIQDVTSLK